MNEEKKKSKEEKLLAKITPKTMPSWKWLQNALYHLRDPKIGNRWQIWQDESEVWHISWDGNEVWECPNIYVHNAKTENVSLIMYEYIRSPLKRLDSIANRCGVVKKLKAMDRRVGRKRWWEILRKNPTDDVRAVVQARIDVRDKDKKAREKQRMEDRRRKAAEQARLKGNE